MVASLPTGAKLIATGVTSPFLVPMKVTLMLALLVALPWVFYQVWAFVAPGLYEHEKRLVLPLVFSSSVLFVAGTACSAGCSTLSATSRRRRLPSCRTSKTTSIS
jgi:sec-independent protein translocase protein TatC